MDCWPKTPLVRILCDFHAKPGRSHPIMYLELLRRNRAPNQCAVSPGLVRLWCVTPPNDAQALPRLQRTGHRQSAPENPRAGRAPPAAFRPRRRRCARSAAWPPRTWGERRVVGQTRRHHVERFAVALQRQQSIDIIFGEAVRPRAHLPVGFRHFFLALAQLLFAQEFLGAFRGDPSFQLQLMTPLVQRAARNAE